MTAPVENTEFSESGIEDRLGQAFDLEREAENQELVSETEEVAEEQSPQGEYTDVEAVEDVSEEPEESEEVEEGEPEAEEEVKEEPGEEHEIRTLDDLAAAFEIEPEQLTQHLQVQIGEETLPLSEVIERASTTPLPAQLEAAVSEQRQAIEQAEATRNEEFQANETAFLGTLNLLISQIEQGGQFSDEAMAALKNENPEQWAVASEEKRQLHALIDSSIKAAHDHQQLRQQQSYQAYETRATEEGMKLVQAIPEWQDQETAIREATEIGEWVVQQYGFTEEELGDMPDHRLALVFRDNFLAHQAETKAKETKKTLTKKKLRARKSVVPTRPKRARGDAGAKARAAARQRQRETARDPDRATEHVDATSELMGDFL
jgi:hypothetical protein